MCLFNPEVLRQKVQDALLVLEATNEESKSQTVSSRGATREYSSPRTTSSEIVAEHRSIHSIHSFYRRNFPTRHSILYSLLYPTPRPPPRLSDCSSPPSRNLDSFTLSTYSRGSRSNQRIHGFPSWVTSFTDQAETRREAIQSDQVYRYQTSCTSPSALFLK